MSSLKNTWCTKILGQKLLKCNSKDNNFELLKSSQVLQNVQITGLYFSFANINKKNDDISNKLLFLYEKLNNENGANKKKFEVIQIVLWVNNDVFDNFEKNQTDCLIGVPWFAVPFNEIDLKARLSRRYRIKSGVPSLVLLENDGTTISISAQDKLLEDSFGVNFPWKPRPITEILKDISLQKGGLFLKEQNHTKENIRLSDLKNGITGIYFSANWCPPCRAFVPQLCDFYNLIRTKAADFEIIFVSSDRSMESFTSHLENMPWYAVPFEEKNIRSELAQLYGIRGIPTLLLLDTNFRIITMDARSELLDDPLAKNFPWKPKSVNLLTERYAAKLQDYPSIVLFVDAEESEMNFAETILGPVSEEYYKKNNISINSIQEDFHFAIDNENFLQFLIAVDNETSDLVRDLIHLEDEVPLLVGIDLPNRKFCVMENTEINLENTIQFVDQFKNGTCTFVNICDCQNTAKPFTE